MTSTCLHFYTNGILIQNQGLGVTVIAPIGRYAERALGVRPTLFNFNEITFPTWLMAEC